MVEYTVAMCNYNMAGTLRRSIESVILQLPSSEFEVLVVDGGSDDGSIDILEELANEHDNFRYVALDPDPDRRLGADRQVSFEHANGNYVLFQIDTDDFYYRGITDFVTVYEALDDIGETPEPLMLKGEAIVMAPREYMLEHGFHNLTGAEDMDLYRRALANNAILFIKHFPSWEQLGYGKTDMDRLKRAFNEQVCNFQTGVTAKSYLQWLLSDCMDFTRYTWKQRLAELALLPYSWYTAQNREQFPVPKPYDKMGQQQRERFEQRKTLSEFEKEYDLDIRNQLSEAGEEIFYGDGVSETDADIPSTRSGTVRFPASGTQPPESTSQH